MSRIGTKLNEIYDDLSHHVTKIYDRNNLHLAFDLTYHSVLSFQLGSAFVKKGYVESLIIGDTGCGKTSVAAGFIQHYRLGESASGESAKYTGLVGGLEQISGRWHITWGKIPINHRRLLIIDEVSGLPKEDIEKMSQIRSDGFVEIVKIRTEKTTAQTRLIWMSNPRQSMSIHDYDSGAPLIANVIGKNEDIRRFDFALILNRNDIDIQAVDNKVLEIGNTTSQRYTSDLCRDLVLWAWSRKPHQVILGRDTVSACVEFASRLCAKYSGDCPIVYPVDQKTKMARLATALACRLFSTKDGESVIVQPDHVEYIYHWLQQQYDTPAFAFDEWSLERNTTELELTEDLAKIINGFGVQGCRLLLTNQYLKSENLNEALGGNMRELANEYFSALLKLRAIKRHFSYYVKSPAFIIILKKYIKNPSIVDGLIAVTERQEF